jgi:hypothetical protein
VTKQLEWDARNQRIVVKRATVLVQCVKMQSTVRNNQLYKVEMTPEMDTWNIARSIKFAQVPSHVIVPVQCVKMRSTVRNDQL